MQLSTLLLVLFFFVKGHCWLRREEAAFRRALVLLESCGQNEDLTKAIGQLTAVFGKMKEEIVFLKTALRVTEMDISSEADQRKDSRNLYSRPISRQGIILPSDTATTTTTRRPKSTRAPEVKTLTAKEQEMHDAASRGWDVTIALLCGEGINPNAADASANSYTPLHLSVIGRHLPAAVTLLRCGANVNAPDRDGNTPLHLAVAREDHWMAGLLLLAKAIPYVTNVQGRTPYQAATSAKDSNFAGMFNVTLLTWFRGRRLLSAREKTTREYVRNGYYVELVKYCIEGTIDPNVGDLENNLNTALHVAALSQWNHPMLVQTLVRCGGDVNALNLQGNTPLHLAISSSNSPAASALLLQGADPFVANRQGITAYSMGSQTNNTYIRALFTYPRFDWYLNNLLL